jgi:hypothetical protein
MLVHTTVLLAGIELKTKAQIGITIAPRATVFFPISQQHFATIKFSMADRRLQPSGH